MTGRVIVSVKPKGGMRWPGGSLRSGQNRRPNISAGKRRSLRKAIFDRDSHRCVLCGGNRDLTLDHVIPVAKGGHPTAHANLVTLCRACNDWKADRLVDLPLEGLMAGEAA